MSVSICVSPSPFQLSNQLTFLYETWYERCANGNHSDFVVYKFLLSLLTAWLTRKPLRWERTGVV